MHEGYNPGDGFIDDGEFDSVFEHTVPSAGVPFYHNGLRFELTPANAALRLFFSEGIQDYSHIIVYLDDGSSAHFKPDNEVMHELARIGAPVELPDKPDETDQEFMDEYMRVWTADARAELDELQ